MSQAPHIWAIYMKDSISHHRDMYASTLIPALARNWT